MLYTFKKIIISSNKNGNPHSIQNYLKIISEIISYEFNEIEPLMGRSFI